MNDELKNVTATVKWYKADKGFGFIRLSDGSGEAFLHSKVLAPLGEVTLTEGTILVCDVVPSPKGPQVAAIHSVTPAAPAEPKPPREPKARRTRTAAVPPVDGKPAKPQGVREVPQRRVERLPAALMAISPDDMTYGTVRWYNLDSQSGLIDPWNDETGIGVYFDRTILRQSGLDIVADGEDVRFVAEQGDSGPFALRVELA
ncbi:cold-shock protein [Azospirillum rugosum]|uniref:CspA family cold shock protein n=1 Tax=Azospirillum rugosum TaxID=416170 RepID=A0ABS4SJQ0_9PROT|nr:cold shock domain-containing protein [Azospirillum rugosum]MBP2292786.1 CspA family cold shock protein [Azospirillum rugosum]MDQ0527045.1 CspA family cold shock protein [Azospirillum rugosum]